MFSSRRADFDHVKDFIFETHFRGVVDLRSSAPQVIPMRGTELSRDVSATASVWRTAKTLGVIEIKSYSEVIKHFLISRCQTGRRIETKSYVYSPIGYVGRRNSTEEFQAAGDFGTACVDLEPKWFLCYTAELYH